jgi:hypothetical protein
VVEIDNGTVTTQFAAPEASIADRIVTTGATYRYRVKALSRTGTLSTAWSSYSASVAAGGDTTAPGVITSPSITGQLGSIFAAWTNPTDDDFSHVKIYRHTSNVSGSSTFVGSVLADNATLYVPLASTTYYFWAATVDRTGNEGAKTAIGSAQALPVGDLAELDTVGTSRIDAGAVTTSRLATDAVTANEIAAGAVGSTEIATGAVTTSRIAAGAVTSTELGAGSVTTSRLAADAVTANEIAAGAVAASELATGAVTTAKIAAGAVTATEIDSGAVTNAKLGTDAVTTIKITANSVTKPARYESSSETDWVAAGIATGPITSRTTLFDTSITASGAEIIVDGSFFLRLQHSQDDVVLYIVVERSSSGGGGTPDVFLATMQSLAISGDGFFNQWMNISFSDTPPAGTVTYYVRVYHTYSIGSPGGFVTWKHRNRTMSFLEAKR